MVLYIPFLKAGKDKSVKQIITRLELPTEMGEALSAQYHPPDIPGEPGKFSTRLVYRMATGSILKATEIIHNSGGVEKRVPMLAMDLDLLLSRGNPITARAAEKFLFPLLLFIIRRLYICIVILIELLAQEILEGSRPMLCCVSFRNKPIVGKTSREAPAREVLIHHHHIFMVRVR